MVTADFADLTWVTSLDSGFSKSLPLSYFMELVVCEFAKIMARSSSGNFHKLYLRCGVKNHLRFIKRAM